MKMWKLKLLKKKKMRNAAQLYRDDDIFFAFAHRMNSKVQVTRKPIITHSLTPHYVSYVLYSVMQRISIE